MNKYSQKLWDAITSLSLTIVCLALLMVLVVACTLAQVRLGTFAAVSLYMRAWFYWMDLGDFRIPIFPAGATVGLVLMVNLVAAQAKRLELSWGKSGIWVVHAGLILLFVGEFVTGAFQVDGRLAIEEGQTVDFVEVPRHVELAVTDVTDPASDEVFGIPETALARGRTIPLRSGNHETPLTVRVKRYHRNVLFMNAGPTLPAVGADQGAGVNVAMQEIAPVTTDDRIDTSAAVVEIQAGGRTLGTWLASNAIESPQPFTYGGRRYELALRSQRQYLPYSLTLEKFRHDVYPGTDIPKNFSSLVRLRNPGTGEDRNVLIYMNQPLRYDGKAFYQASFGKNDTLSILQVVSNPGWLLPYVSTVFVTLGLLIHFGISLRRGVRRAGAAAAARAAQEA